jgi:hypothetical protein
MTKVHEEIKLVSANSFLSPPEENVEALKMQVSEHLNMAQQITTTG